MSRVPSRATPDVSVIIPVYNRDALLRRTVESVLDQEGVSVEVVIVDDGSEDGSRAVAEQIGRDHAEVVVDGFDKNHGVSAARNRGLELATAGVITFLDSDDRMPDRRLEGQLAALGDEPTGLIMGLQALEVADGIELPRSIAATLEVPEEDRFYIMSMLGHRDTFDTVGLFLDEYRISQDLEYMIRARDLGVPIVQVPEVWVIRGIYGDNLVYDDASLKREMMQVFRTHHQRQDSPESGAS